MPQAWPGMPTSGARGARRDRVLDRAGADVNAGADPQAAALGVTPAGSMVLLCLASGLFISFGAGLIGRNTRA
jgi:hypothetical protein